MTRALPSRSRAQDGFTLIETLIAMLIMTIAVVTIVGALATMLQLTAGHRGSAVVETSTRSFGQAVEAQAQRGTTLAAAVTPGATSISVTDASLLPPGSNDSYVLIDREVLRISSVDRTADAGEDAVTVVRPVTGSTAVAHALGSSVVPFVRCTTDTSLYEPDPSAYTAVKGIQMHVTGVTYWRAGSTPGSGSFVDRDACAQDFSTKTACRAGSILPECMSGLARVELSVKSSVATAPDYDKRFRNIDTTTSVLVRYGSG